MSCPMNVAASAPAMPRIAVSQNLRGSRAWREPLGDQPGHETDHNGPKPMHHLNLPGVQFGTVLNSAARLVFYDACFPNDATHAALAADHIARRHTSGRTAWRTSSAPSVSSSAKKSGDLLRPGRRGRAKP